LQSKLQVFRGLEQLSSLFWQGVMAIYKLGVIQPRFPFVVVEILTTFWFLCHHFVSRYARKPIKGSKNSDDSLFSKKLERKNWLIGLASKKLSEQLGLHRYAVSTHPGEIVLEPPPKNSWIRLCVA